VGIAVEGAEHIPDGQWVKERLVEGYESSIKTAARLFEATTRFQRLEIYETPYFGKILVLDGAVQTTEKDESFYHEMLVTLPLLYHGAPEKVLVIGGGDGGALRHALDFPVQEAWMCELDEEVTEACRRFMPAIAGGAFEDPRAHVVFEDGFDFLGRFESAFDAILIDSPDPMGEAKKLFSDEFYALIKKALRPGGVVSCQAGSPWLQSEEGAFVARSLARAFRFARPYLGQVLSYPGVVWMYVFASDDIDPLAVEKNVIKTRLDELRERGKSLRYLSPSYATACFALPAWVERVVEEGSWR